MAFQKLIQRADQLLARLKSQPDTVEVVELNSWYRAAQDGIEETFGNDSKQMQKWVSLDETLSDKYLSSPRAWDEVSIVTDKLYEFRWLLDELTLSSDKASGALNTPPIPEPQPSTAKTEQYDVALSFAGEDRAYAEELANLLRAGGYRVFYDKYEKARLWGKNLYTHLSDVYSNKADYCVMFLSQHYAKKVWTNHERESAQARAFKEREEYILPLRLDDSKIPGVLDTIGYLDLRYTSIAEVFETLVEKLKARTPGA